MPNAELRDKNADVHPQGKGEAAQPESPESPASPAEHEDAKPVDKHPDGTPMTQDEIDTYWLQRATSRMSHSSRRAP